MEVRSKTKSNIDEILEQYKEIGSDRYNLLNLYTLTIDTKHTQKFDDALSLIKKDNKDILFVHVSDIINNINYHCKNNCKLKTFLQYHGISNYNSTNSLIQGAKRNSITLVAVYDDGYLIEYKFIKSIINVNVNIDSNRFDSSLKKTNITKEVCNQAKNLCEFYQKLKIKNIHRNAENDNKSKSLLLEEMISIYTYLLGNELINKKIGIYYEDILIKKSANSKGHFYVKATSPLYKGESYLNQLLIYDFIFSDDLDNLDFWKDNKAMIEEYLLEKKKNNQKKKDINKKAVSNSCYN
ncbi:MAG: hypothetical protein PHN42_00320 [Bacilli bacterium]|nr:hypothetical protein [Bacilli bacterium]